MPASQEAGFFYAAKSRLSREKEMTRQEIETYIAIHGNGRQVIDALKEMNAEGIPVASITESQLTERIDRSMLSAIEAQSVKEEPPAQPSFPANPSSYTNIAPRDYSNIQFVRVTTPQDSKLDVPKWVIALIIGFFVLVLFGSMLMSVDTNEIESTSDVTTETLIEQIEEPYEAPESETIDDITYTGTTVAELITSITDASSDASENYKGNYYAVRGMLGSIGDDYITIYGDDSLQFVMCYFTNDEQHEQAKTLTKGDIIVVKGQVTYVAELLNSCDMDIDSIE